MIKNKYINVICWIFIALAVVFTVLFASGKLTFISDNISNNSPYAEKLFDTSYVHSINIEIDESEWQDLIDNAQQEQYHTCNITIDGTVVDNVGVRAKGNTSLSTVASMNSERYSLKVQFDEYDSNTSYYGLDKLALNNIIMDNTYMKDYFSYTMMNEIGAYAPLCSYAYVTVNGEDWGLFLAVEGVEEAYARRNFGSDFGQIYKPESAAMGGGDKDRDNDPPQMPDMQQEAPSGEQGGMPDMQQEAPNGEQGGMPDMQQGVPNGEQGEMPDMQQGAPNGEQGGMPDMQQEAPNGEQGGMPDMQQGNRGGGPGNMGSGVVALQYQDDDIDSYSAIFDYAMFSPDTADKNRLISSIKQLNESENIEAVVNVDEVLRYFVAHNFTDNFDSYTGSLMHNYYLYEKDGQMSMIAWDYNLAFGGFGMGGGGRNRGGSGENTVDNATQMVNYPIDTPVSGTTLEDRPMLGKLLENEEYMERYHELFDQFISEYFESGDFEAEYNRVYNMIAPYVQKDPTKFCTFEEFEKGAQTLLEFCTLRAESIRGQLEGTIPATTDGQSADTTSLIDASHLTISDMGEQSMGGGRNREGGEGQEPNAQGESGERQQPFQPPEGMFGQQQKTLADYSSELMMLGACFAAVILGIVIAVLFKKRKN